MKPMLTETIDHATDKGVQDALETYTRRIEEGNAAHVDPIYEKAQKRRGDRPPMKQAGGNNYR